MPSDELQAAILEAQATLQQAGDALMPRDPQRFIMAGLSHLLGVLGRSTRRWEQAVADVIAARAQVTADDRAAMIAAVEDGAYRGTRKEAQRVVRTLDRKQATLIGLDVGGALVAGLLDGVVGQRWLLTHPDITGMQFADQPDHSRVCWWFVVPPTQQAPAAPPTTPGRR